MKVVREPLEGTDIERLTVTEPDGSDHHVGETIGYRCPECEQADETLQQIWHDEECSHAGKHGRSHYDNLVPDVPGRPTPEFDPEHQITVVRYGKTEGRTHINRGEVVAFICECGNADEDLFELVHDEACDLAGRHGRAAEMHARSDLAADGGTRSK